MSDSILLCRLDAALVVMEKCPRKAGISYPDKLPRLAMKGRLRTGICATAIVTAICAPGAYAGGRFDGAWTVVVTTTKGPCNDTYRFSGEIIDGVMHYSDSSLNNFSGRVGPSGSVSVRLSLGSKNAVATGRLTDKAGSGTWHGQAPEGPCAGTWEAERL
jgi:hypothetical protein